MSTSTHPPLPSSQTGTPAGLQPPKKKHTGWLWLVVALAIAGLAWFLHVPPNAANSATGKKGGGKGGRGPMGDIPVAVAKAHKGNMPVYLSGLGSVSAFYTVIVRTRVAGQLMNVFVKEGDFVKEGQIIAQVDPRPFQVQLEVAEGQMARDQALLANAKLDLQRYQTLLAQDAIPKQQLDTQISTVAQYEGNTKTDQANIDSAKLNLTYAKVTAPITGRIGLRQVDPGNIVQPTDATGLVIITQLQPIAALFTIPEDNLPQVLKKLRTGAVIPVEAYNRDNSQKLDAGKLLTVDNSIDPATGTSKLKAVFDNRNNTLFPNQFVNIRMLIDTLRDQIIIPEVAVQQGAQGSFVYIVGEDAKVKVQPVTTGIVEGANAQILTGVEEGQAVVTDGTDKLQNGTKVRIRELGGPGRPSGGRKKAGPPAAAPATATSDSAPVRNTPPNGSPEGRKAKKAQENQ